MVDGGTDTGSRDDLQIDISRCLRMRFCESSCRQCVDICPHASVTLDGGLSVNPDQCHGCLLCTSVCPVGALEQNGDFNACLAKLSKVPEPVLGCIRTKENSSSTTTCLGGLSEEHLLTLCYSLAGPLTLNLSACNDCQNNAMTPRLLHRLDVLSANGLLEEGCSIVVAESAHDISCHDESVDRRGFFKSFRNSLFQSAAVILSGKIEQDESSAAYSAKRVPIRRKLLNGTRDKLSSELKMLVCKHFDSFVSFREACTMCQGCVAICPTGALQTLSADGLPVFDNSACTGCGLCQEFCSDRALELHLEFGLQ